MLLSFCVWSIVSRAMGKGREVNRLLSKQFTPPHNNIGIEIK